MFGCSVTLQTICQNNTTLSHTGASGTCFQGALRCCNAPSHMPEQHDAHAKYMQKAYCFSGKGSNRFQESVYWAIRYVFWGVLFITNIISFTHTDCTRKQKLQKMHIDFSKRAKCKKCTQKVLIIKHTKTAKKKAHTKHKKCTQEMQKTHQKCQNDIPVRAKMIYRF